jgi:hypothetical protein
MLPVARFLRRLAVGTCVLLVAYTHQATHHVARAEEVLDRVIARVNERAITLSDAKAAIGLGLVVIPPNENQVAAAARGLIDRYLILIEVGRFSPPEPAPQALASEVATTEAKAGTPAQLEALMRATGVDRTRIREFARDTLRIRAYIAQRFGASASDPGTVDQWVRDLRRRAQITCQVAPGVSC